jgi:membrane-bound ClpP family serine protease
MRNNIDKETYTWTSKVFGILGVLLLLVNVFLYFSKDPSHVMAFKFSSAVMFLLLAVVVWLRLEYLKVFKVAVYKARRVPMWASIFVFVAVAFARLF